MRGAPSVPRRVRTLSAMAWARERRRIDRILCEQEGVDPDEFARECADLKRRFQHAGAVTRHEQATLIARELGVIIEEVLAEAEAIAERALAVSRGAR